MKFAQFVIGPAGVGKTRYCDVLRQHFEAAGRPVHVMNLDPAADELPYSPSIDIRDLISLSDVMEDPDSRLGPNGGLVFCLEFLCQNVEWLLDRVGDFSDDYLIVDCPGQIELYSHMPVMRQVLKQFEQLSYRICTVYLLDATFLTDSSRFIAGTLSALSCMVRLEETHINVITKMDQEKARIKAEVETDPDWQRALAASSRTPFSASAASARAMARAPKKAARGAGNDDDDDDGDDGDARKPKTEKEIEDMLDDELERRYGKYFYCDIESLQYELDADTPDKFRGLNRAISTLLEDYSLINFVPLDISNEDSIDGIVQRIDMALQFGEDADVQTRDQHGDDGEERDDGGFEGGGGF
jgi:GTPase SAR1 family protein